MPVSEREVVEWFPVHWLVWNNEHEKLQKALQNNEWTPEEMERKDPRGRTALLLAVTLGRGECARALLAAGAEAECAAGGWSAVQEATARGDAALLAAVLARRDHRRHAARARAVPRLLRDLSLAPDFYVEMKWEFTSWVPLVSRLCPFDTYRVYKRGANVRVDTTLLGFHDNRWERGDRTYIFSGDGDSARLVELDHLAGTAWSERLEGAVPAADWPPPTAAHIAHRLRTPVHINYLDTDKICFERNKCGIWGWRQDKSETVNGYECKVFSANNVELVSKSRWEHVPRAERRAARAPPLAGLLAVADDEPAPPPPAREGGPEEADVSWEEYFDEGADEPEIGRAREVTTKVQKFRATLWLCEDYPLELREQIMPILDLMASISSPHFVKLKDFIQMQLPSGFPVKIEIPLFHVLNARITFGNIFARESGVRHVECVAEGARLACLVDDACFALGRGYRAAGPLSDDRLASLADDDEELLYFAIQQSLMEEGTQCDQVDVWEALRGARPADPARPAAPAPPAALAPPDALDAPAGPPVRRAADADADLMAQEQTMLQRAIEESLRSAAEWRQGAAAADGAAVADGAAAADGVQAAADGVQAAADGVQAVAATEGLEEELRAALALSAAEQAARDQLQADEQRALDEALRLSLLED